MAQDIQQLIIKNQGIIRTITRVFYVSQADREDLFQDIVVRVLENYKSFRQESRFSTWLYRVALNTAISHKKKNRKLIPMQGNEHRIPEEEDHGPYDKSDIMILYRAIDRLNKIEKAIIFLYLEEKSYREISEIMGISEKNTGVKIVRIKKKLKGIMESFQK